MERLSNRRQVFSIGISVLFLASSIRRSLSQEVEQYNAIINFLRKLTVAVDTLAVDIDKLRLARYLRGLGNSLEGILSAKRSLREALLLDIDISQIESEAKLLSVSLELAIAKLENVSFVLKETLQEEGKTAVRQLSIALQDRKGWVNALLQETTSPDLSIDRREFYSKKATESSDALEEAIDLLAILLNKLD